MRTPAGLPARLPCPVCGGIATCQPYLEPLDHPSRLTTHVVVVECRCPCGEFAEDVQIAIQALATAPLVQLLAKELQIGMGGTELEPGAGGVELPQPKAEPLRELQGSVIGYRAWRLQDWSLHSTAVSVRWIPGVNEAVCHQGGYLGYLELPSHRAPAEDCDCGLYALARFEEGAVWWSGMFGQPVLGAVEAWSDPDPDSKDGRAYLHGDGFRTQYAKVVLLATDDTFPAAKNGAIRALAGEHGADVCRKEHLEDAAKEHGQLVPDELLKWAREGGDQWSLAASAVLPAAVARYSGGGFGLRIPWRLNGP